MLARRWSIAVLVTIAIAISYLDRQTLPVAVDAIRQDIAISDKDYSRLVSIFLLGLRAHVYGRRQADRRAGNAARILLDHGGWSLACASHGLATGFWFLAVCRFLLGLGEGGGFPAATKAVAEWFPARERSTAMGMINAGTAIGAVVAAPAVAAIIAVANWRWAFFAAGGVGLLWTVWWMREYFPPAEHPRLSAAGAGGNQRSASKSARHRQQRPAGWIYSSCRRSGDWCWPNA